ncbi:TolB family protein [Fibrella forsythiae]|uniref:Uncharacterized protein n=1 Tax=Fibrella forsythiae TaxID=2817061 RepID=A0ABS3JEL0_9BACT|nr:hypothetical protein [Fibrella forsythiae]MBO0948438.1 hypothetical protein [Fibrella forsythiae]
MQTHSDPAFAGGLADGPDQSPDGKHVYFNLYHTIPMQIWRMPADGQLTFDDKSNWFAHLSPDTTWIAHIAYASDASRPICLAKTMHLNIRTITNLSPDFCIDQGTINVVFRSPVSQKIAFGSYLVK